MDNNTNQVDVKSQIIQTLIYNQPFFKDLALEFKNKRDSLLSTEKESMHDSIREQYKAICISLLASNIAPKLGVSMEPVIEVLETINIIDYLE